MDCFYIKVEKKIEVKANLANKLIANLKFNPLAMYCNGSWYIWVHASLKGEAAPFQEELIKNP